MCTQWWNASFLNLLTCICDCELGFPIRTFWQDGRRNVSTIGDLHNSTPMFQITGRSQNYIWNAAREMAQWLEAALAEDLGLVPSTAMGAQHHLNSSSREFYCPLLVSVSNAHSWFTEDPQSIHAGTQSQNIWVFKKVCRNEHPFKMGDIQTDFYITEYQRTYPLEIGSIALS